MSRSLTAALLSIPLIAAGYAFGKACDAFGDAYELLLAPSADLLVLVAKLLLALVAVAMTAGLVAVLTRPLSLAVGAVALSALALLLGWQISPASVVLAVVYLVVSAAYVLTVDRELGQRIQFSLHPVVEAQTTLRLALILVACGGLYLACAPQIQQEGFAIPDKYLDPLADQMERQVLGSVPEGQRSEVARQFRQQFRSLIDGLLDQVMGRFDRYLPALIVAGVFTSLATVVSFVAWVPGLLLQLLLALLAALRLTRVVTETREVQRLTLA
jgi:hypothetical protein